MVLGTKKVALDHWWIWLCCLCGTLKSEVHLDTARLSGGHPFLTETKMALVYMSCIKDWHVGMQEIHEGIELSMTKK